MGSEKEKEERLLTAISTTTLDNNARLSMALRWFAGGDPIDIMQVHGVGYTEVYNSVWQVVDAIHLCPALKIRFPSYEQQMKIAENFGVTSPRGFSGCAGCIDGMLVWMN